MKKMLLTAVVLLVSVLTASAQSGPKKVYDESADPMAQIDQALEKAKAEDKYVICQVGGNWCPWCLRLADFVEKDSVVSKMVADNFVYIHVNYTPRQSVPAAQLEKMKQMMQRLNNPSRFGFPVLVVLNEQGEVLHIQDSSFLEEGKGYDEKKVVRFLKNWAPQAVKTDGFKPKLVSSNNK